MTRLKLAAAVAFVITAKLTHAAGCSLTIEANDVMQYNVKELSVPVRCTDIEVTLKHSGQLEAKVMGHDWVLAKTSDVSRIVTAGMAAGLAHGYLSVGDKRIIAATRVVGGGESTSTKFSTGALVEGASYTFFCTAPGHATVMRGRFNFGDAKHMARIQR